ncbi:beta-lactamase family protein [bacterium]|nr:beta-lactamase family protein [bacterium]
MSGEVAALLAAGIAQGHHLGGQVCAMRDGREALHLAVGEARPGEPMTAAHLLHWFSAGKPFAAVAFGQLWERGLCHLDDPVARHLPEFAQHGKEAITLRHVLTHTGGFRSRLDLEWSAESWTEHIARVCAAKRERDWSPGRKAGYHIASGWFVLAEVLRRLDGRTYDCYVREEIAEPLGLADTWFALSAEGYRAYGDRLAPIFTTEGERSHPLEFWLGASGAGALLPGASARGPVRDLARFYAMLLGGGQLDGCRLLLPQTVEALVARQRTGLYDHTFGHEIDWGLGFIIESSRYGVETVPYGYGRHASVRTFGHGGQQSCSGFADPECGLAVAIAVNGMPGERVHQRRFLDLLSALYVDLDLA